MYDIAYTLWQLYVFRSYFKFSFKINYIPLYVYRCLSFYNEVIKSMSFELN